MASSDVVTLYSRPGCGLCEEALNLLRSLHQDLRFEINEVDIEADDELLQRYVFAIPVIAVGEREVARAPIRAGALEDALRQALS